MAISFRAKHFVVIGLVLLAAAAATAWFLLGGRSAAVTIPKSITDKTLFPIYVPSQLPAGYKVAEDSFGNNEGVLIFSIRDDSGRSIALTQQSMPAVLDFTKFYEQQMKDVRKVEGVPYESVVGQASIHGTPNSRLLSVRADTTWLMASSQNASDSELEFIARNLRRYDK